MRTNKRHADICRSHDVSRAFGDDCTELLTDLCPTYEKLDFMNRLWNAGNPMFCILRCTQHMLHPKPHFDVIDRLLRNVAAADSWSAKYFHVLIRATTGPPLDMEGILTDFWSIFKNLQQYRSDIMGGSTSFRFRRTWYKRWMPPGMYRQRFCPNPHSCPGDGRRGNYRGFLPVDDDEYVFTHFCICCRLDGEVRWLIDVFGIDHGS